MSPSDIALRLEHRGFKAAVRAGRYSAFPGLKGVVAAALNAVIGVSGRLGLTISPYYVIVAERR